MKVWSEKGLGRFLVKKCVRMAVLVFLVSFSAFMLVSLSPLDPLTANVGQTAMGSMSPEQIEKLEAYWGVGTPPIKRFLSWAWDFFQGEMGTSLLYRQPVAAVIRERFANSIGLMAVAWVISGGLGFGLGIWAGAKRGSAVDRILSLYALTMASIPAFWLALMLLMVFAVKLSWLPVGFSVPIGIESKAVTFADRFRHAILPATALSLTGISSIMLHTREKMIQVMESDYVLYARARGESFRRIVWRHGLPNVMLPALTLQFGAISEIFGGSVLVEQVFSYPGLGQAAVTAGLGGDVPLLLGITVISSVIVFGGNMTADLLCVAADPRLRQKTGGRKGQTG